MIDKKDDEIMEQQTIIHWFLIFSWLMTLFRWEKLNPGWHKSLIISHYLIKVTDFDPLYSTTHPRPHVMLNDKKPSDDANLFHYFIIFLISNEHSVNECMIGWCLCYSLYALLSLVNPNIFRLRFCVYKESLLQWYHHSSFSRW